MSQNNALGEYLLNAEPRPADQSDTPDFGTARDVTAIGRSSPIAHRYGPNWPPVDGSEYKFRGTPATHATGQAGRASTGIVTSNFGKWQTAALRAVPGLCAAGLLAACTATTTVTAPASTGATTPSGGTASASAAATPGAEPSAAARNLIATPAVKRQLLATYDAKQGFQPGWAELTPSGVYYGQLTSTGAYWAMATFSPLPAAPQKAQVAMQDDGATGIFTEQPGEPWTMRFGDFPGPCPGELPQALMQVWNLSYVPACPSPSG